MRIIRCEDCGAIALYQWARNERAKAEEIEEVFEGLCGRCYEYHYSEKLETLIERDKELARDIAQEERP